MTLDDVRRYWDARPCNIRHSDAPVGSLQYSQEVTRRKFFVEPHITGFAEFETWRGQTVLDAGCGIGTMALAFARAGARVVGCDVSQQSLAIAMQRAENEHVTRKQFAAWVGSVEQLEQERWGTYDLIWSFGVIHHTPNPDAALQAFRRVSKPGTTLKLMVYHRHSYKVLWIALTHPLQVLRDGLSSVIQRYSEAQTGCPVTYTYTRRDIVQRVESTGFKVRSVQVDHIFPYNIEAYKRKEYVKVWYWRIMPRHLFRWFERRFGWHLLVEAEAV